MSFIGEGLDIGKEWNKAGTGERAAIVGGGIVILIIAFVIYKRSQGQNTTPYQAATPGSSQTAGSTPGLQSGWQTVGPNQTPVLPPGYGPNFDPNGNLVDYGPIPTPTPTPTPTPAIFKTGPIWLGPTGVLHYTVQPGDTLRSISGKYVPGGTWNSIYAIPKNQEIFGKLSPQQAANYAPKPGTVITLPGNATVPTSPGQPKPGGGVYGTGVASQHGVRIAPSHESSMLARVYSRRNNQNRPAF